MKFPLVFASMAIVVTSQSPSPAFAASAKGITPVCETPVVVPKEGYKNEGQADDVAIWVHPEDSSKSRIIAAVKGAGIYVYDLDCNKVQDDLNPKENKDIKIQYINNLDLRYNVNYGSEVVDLVVGADEKKEKLYFFKVTPEGEVKTLKKPKMIKPAQNLGDNDIVTHGLCMYQSPAGELHIVSTQEGPGALNQYRLGVNDDQDRATLQLVRHIEFGEGVEKYTEACVFDDEHGYLYVAQEGKGVWKFPAIPTGTYSGKAEDMGSIIHSTKIGGEVMRGTVEGLSIYYGSNGSGYLFANNEGDDSVAIFDRNTPHKYITSFRGKDGSGIDSIQSPDGNDVSNVNFGGKFSSGLFISHDDEATGGEKGANFKFFSLEDIMELSPLLNIDTSRDPRGN